MQTGRVTTEPIAEFFDRECCASVHRLPDEGEESDALGRELLSALDVAGFAGGSALELGSGDGLLSRLLISRGASSVTGVDLSPQSVVYASSRAAAAGLGHRLSYRVADASSVLLPPHDAVVSERVFCCFPDAPGLLANTLPLARSVYALVLPESRGLLGVVTHVIVAAENAWRWLRRDPFRAYVHDVRLIERTIRSAGFRRRVSRRHGHWRVLVYSRA